MKPQTLVLFPLVALLVAGCSSATENYDIFYRQKAQPSYGQLKAPAPDAELVAQAATACSVAGFSAAQRL